MSRVNVSQGHDKPLEDVREIVGDVAEKLSNRYGLKAKWQGKDSIHFKRSGVTGELHIHPEKVTIDINLGILLGMYASKIEKELKSTMAEKLA
ncbi:MAG: polyhydroxyalkanoic acid system family protein [Pseudomonadales bacterium]